MKTTYVIASFLVATAGAVGAGAALDLAHYAGSDTLLTVTQQLIVAANSGAGIAGLTYVGGGSGAGENQMKAGTQQTAPMSRFFAAGSAKPACTVTAPNGTPQTSEGLVVALDGVAMIGNDAVVTQQGTGCNDLNGSQTDSSKQPALGLRGDGTFTWTAFTSTDPHGNGDGCSYVTYNKAAVTVPAGSYKFLDWQDVLRVLWGGVTHAYTVNGSTKAATVDTGLGSPPSGTTATNPVRWALLANWSSIWENQTDATCATGACKCIHHMLRRDDWSGTTDTVVGLLGLAGIASDHSTDPFANSLKSAIVGGVIWPATSGVPAGNPRYMQSQQAPTDQDYDPIRVACVGTGANAGDDIVCEGDGTLGVMLPIEPSSDLTVAAAYPTAQATGKIDFANAPISNVGVTPVNFCPNGDLVVFGNECFFPIAPTADKFANLTLSGTVPQFTFPVTGSPAVTSEDARVFNLVLHNSAGALQNGSNRLPIQSAFYRNWGPRSVPVSGEVRCTLTDATQQIGCVIGQIPTEKCSIGYAGLLATIQAGADAMRIDGMMPTIGNVQAFSYPVSRKLYFDSMLGFAAVASPELDLAKAYANVVASNPTFSTIISNNGFVNLPSSAPNGTNAYAEDFNEINGCALSGTNSNAFANNNTVGLPNVGTICGNDNNGLHSVEAYERCDDGTANGAAAPATNCTVTCNCAKGGVGTTGLCCFRYDVPSFVGTLVSTGLNGCPAAGTAYPSP